jgi:HK97 family phage major capsid protein
VSNKTNLSPGQRAHLKRLGFDPSDLGRVYNRATPAPSPDDVDRIPTPRNADELADMLADDGRLKVVMGSRQALHTFITRYADAQQGDGTDLRRTVAEETQRFMTQYLRDAEVSNEGIQRVARLNLDPQSRPANMLTSHRQAAAYNPAAPGAVLDKEFQTAAEFFRAAWHLNPDMDLRQKMERIRASASSVVPADGGFLVPEVLRSQLLQIALEMSVVRPRATVVPMDSARVPFPTIDVTSNASSVFGAMIAYWTEESGALTDANPKFGRVVLDAQKLTGMSIVPNELLTDSLISFAALIESLWPRALAWFEDVAYMTGNGVGQPLGFIGASNPASIAVAIESGQASSTILLENIVKMYSRMLPASLNQGVWLCCPDALPELFTMALSVGTGGGPVMLTNAAGPAPMTILGRPLIPTEKANTLGSRGDIVFADLSYYLIGDRQAMSAASSTEYKFGNDQTTYRIIQRVDGKPWIQSAITPQNGGNTLSPFVELAAR